MLQYPIKRFTAEEFEISTDRQLLNLEFIHSFLTGSYWVQGISMDNVRSSIDNSVCFGVFCEGRQVGFARVVSDFARFAHLMDVFVLPEFAGRGLGIWLVETVLESGYFTGCSWSLGTRDAHALYQRFGFAPPEQPGQFLRRK